MCADHPNPVKLVARLPDQSATCYPLRKWKVFIAINHTSSLLIMLNWPTTGSWRESSRIQRRRHYSIVCMPFSDSMGDFSHSRGSAPTYMPGSQNKLISATITYSDHSPSRPCGIINQFWPTLSTGALWKWQEIPYVKLAREPSAPRKPYQRIPRRTGKQCWLMLVNTFRAMRDSLVSTLLLLLLHLMLAFLLCNKFFSA